ncbi:MAG: PorV/PorQ family protein [Candidatus Latescibacteria bacterium]|nr:PorV/PorQ family protein [Candidatus Latescibacterota bacterium]
MIKLWFWTKHLLRKNVLACILFSVLLIQPAFSEEYRSWTGEFMRMGAGARAMGMGNAYTAVEGDVYSSYFNPAALATIDERQLAISFRYLSMDRHFKHVVIGSKVGIDAGFALSWINAGTDDIVGRDLSGNPIGSINDSRNAFSVSFAKQLTKMISVGLNAKVALWKLGGEDAKAFGFDLGIITHPIEHFSLAFVARDVNSRFTWTSTRWKSTIGDIDGQPIEKEDKFPLYYTAGVSYKMLGDKLLLASTLEFIEDNPYGVNLGVSYEFNDTFTCRSGIYNYTSSDELDSGSYTAGFTVRVTPSISADYAYGTDGIDNDNIHCISLIMNYGAE